MKSLLNYLHSTFKHFSSLFFSLMNRFIIFWFYFLFCRTVVMYDLWRWKIRSNSFACRKLNLNQSKIISAMGRKYFWEINVCWCFFSRVGNKRGSDGRLISVVGGRRESFCNESIYCLSWLATSDASIKPIRTGVYSGCTRGYALCLDIRRWLKAKSFPIFH